MQNIKYRSTVVQGAIKQQEKWSRLGFIFENEFVLHYLQYNGSRISYGPVNLSLASFVLVLLGSRAKAKGRYTYTVRAISRYTKYCTREKASWTPL